MSMEYTCPCPTFSARKRVSWPFPAVASTAIEPFFKAGWIKTLAHCTALAGRRGIINVGHLPAAFDSAH